MFPRVFDCLCVGGAGYDREVRDKTARSVPLPELKEIGHLTPLQSATVPVHGVCGPLPLGKVRECRLNHVQDMPVNRMDSRRTQFGEEKYQLKFNTEGPSCGLVISLTRLL